jgi:uncharacterized protein YjbK
MDVDARELELKYALSGEDDVEAFAFKMGNPDKTLEQTNIYFDTPDRALHRGGCMLRVRVVGERVVATFKSDASLKDGYLECREQESSLPLALWQEIEAGERRLEEAAAPSVQAAMDILEPGARLEVLGTVLNTRRVYRLKSGCFLELDRTCLPGGRVDGEIEVETDQPEAVRVEVEALLEEHGIPWAYQNKPKYARFLEALEEAGISL